MIYLAMLTSLCLNHMILADPLSDYVKQVDGYYKYELITTYQMNEYDLYVLNMTSQKWQDESFSNRAIWWHYLCITVPKKLTRTNAAYMLIDGGDNTDAMPQPSDKYVSLTTLFALSTGSIAANLQQVPNQPIIYNKDPSRMNRREDQSVAWTWSEFIKNTSDPTLILRLPMTKAAYKGMDTIVDFCTKLGHVGITKFMISGYSKRGWTAWLTAAVDNERVFAVAPIVMDLLNLNFNLHSHYRSLGGWTFAFGDYFNLNITKYSDSTELYALQQIEDPLTYLSQYRNKKFLVMTTSGDEFFLPDDTYSFWSSLKQVTNNQALLRRIPNAEHLCIGHEFGIMEDLSSFYISAYEDIELPRLNWIMPNNLTHGIIKAALMSQVSNLIGVKVYYAETIDNKRRDFRLAVADPNDHSKPFPNPIVWKTSILNLRMNSSNEFPVYEAAFPIPLNVWLGFFIEFKFTGLDNSTLTLTTETNVIPNVYPFDDCFKESCKWLRGHI